MKLEYDATTAYRQWT